MNDITPPPFAVPVEHRLRIDTDRCVQPRRIDLTLTNVLLAAILAALVAIGFVLIRWEVRIVRTEEQYRQPPEVRSFQNAPTRRPGQHP